jgi:hypothetical protein
MMAIFCRAALMMATAIAPTIVIAIVMAIAPVILRLAIASVVLRLAVASIILLVATVAPIALRLAVAPVILCVSGTRNADTGDDESCGRKHMCDLHLESSHPLIGCSSNA